MRFFCVICVLSLWTGITNSSGADLSLGRQVILNRGLQIQSMLFINDTTWPSNYSVWAGANFTACNSWYTENSEKNLGWTMPWARWMKTDGSNPLTNNEKNQHLAELVSLQYGDELNQDGTGAIDATTLSAMAAAYADWHSQFGSNFLAYSNFGANNASKAMTPAGLAAYMQGANPDMLMFDAYPRQYVTVSTWYAEMQKYRLAALAGNDGTGRQPIPYAQYLDLYRTSYGASLPDESFVRLQEFASWAFGYTFVAAFVYNKPHDATVYPTMFSTDGDSSPTSVFNQVAEANRQSLNLGPALVRLTSTDIRMIPGTGNSLPAGISAWSPGAGGNNYISSIVPIKQPGGANSSSYSDVLIGYFQPLLSDTSVFPFADGTHFMLVNGATTGAATDKAQWYHLTFDFGVAGFDSLQRLSRDTGQIESIPLTHLAGSQYALDWNLEGGTGDLFRFWRAGVPAVIYPPYLDAAGNLIVSGTNVTGIAGGSYCLLSSTNIAAPFTEWTTNTTGIFGTGGSFTNAIGLRPADTQRFFMIKTP